MKIPIVDDVLNKITMYRITLYYLIFLTIVAGILGFFNLINVNPLTLIITGIYILTLCYLSNYIFAYFFKASRNIESVFITALILLLIIPTNFPNNLIFISLASIVSIGIKYLPTIDKRHIFNPAAGALAAITLLIPEYAATWWVGTPMLLPFVFLGGLLVVRKVRREEMVGLFVITYLILISITSIFHNLSFTYLINSLRMSVFDTALFFFAFVMFTEPITSPPTKKLQGYFALLTAFLYATPQLKFFGFVLTPEEALSISNIFSYIVSPKYRLTLKLKEKIAVAQNTLVFNFGKVNNFNFTPGQYMEWTLPHPNADNRGNRRYFSLSSSPAEDVQIAVRFHEKRSSYKKAMLAMQSGSVITANALAGDFTVPISKLNNTVFIAGGIGIAPFRSIIQDLVDKNIKVDLYLFYSNRSWNEVAFLELFQKAFNNGVKTVYTLTDKNNLPENWQGEVGHFTPEFIKKYISDWKSKTFYISGPQNMVSSTQEMLLKAGIKRKNIMTDFFPGF